MLEPKRLCDWKKVKSPEQSADKYNELWSKQYANSTEQCYVNCNVADASVMFMSNINGSRGFMRFDNSEKIHNFEL